MKEYEDQGWNIYRKWILKPKIKNRLDILWWDLHVLDKVSEEERGRILQNLSYLLKKSKDESLLYWSLRFLKDINSFALSSKIKSKIKKIIKKNISKFDSLYCKGKNIFERHMIKEPLEIINKYW